MRTPDARPVGETTEQRADWRAIILDWLRHHEATEYDQRLHLMALDGYREQIAAEARAALLRDAPVVYVATDARSVNVSAIYNNDPQMRYGAATNYDEDDGLWLWGRPMLTPPGTVRRYALVPHPEGEETPT